MIRLKMDAFFQIQGERTEQKMAAHLGLSRTQLWRAKQSRGNIGYEFVGRVLQKYPQYKFDDLFREEPSTNQTT